ncbi:MAG TPA: hypothetical protein PLL32_07995, partial [Anaeromyxobacteraceae bacterium]|nr:hypothetical protein [Anaeromyxobacteraceae bacterium]
MAPRGEFALVARFTRSFAGGEGVRVGGPTAGSYTAQQVLATPAGPLSFDRGWVYVDGRYQGESFRMVNTHLETEDYPGV